jgi:hypothetical protein
MSTAVHGAHRTTEHDDHSEENGKSHDRQKIERTAKLHAAIFQA